MSGALTTIKYILDPRLKLQVIKNVKKRLEGTANQARVLNLLRMGKFEIKKMDGGKLIACYDEESDVKKSVKFNLTDKDFNAIRTAIKQCRQMFDNTNKSDAFTYNESIRDNDYTGKKHENSIRTNFDTIPIEKFHTQCAENLASMTSPQDVYDFFELYTEFEYTKLDKKYEHIFVHRDTLFKFIQEIIPEAGVSQVDNMPGEEAYTKMCKIIQDWVKNETGMISSGLNEIMENFQTFMSMGIKGLLRLGIIKNRHTKTISRLREAQANERQRIEKVLHQKEVRNLHEKVQMQDKLDDYEETVQKLSFLNTATFERNEKLRDENQKILQDLRAEKTRVQTLTEICTNESAKYAKMLKEKEETHQDLENWYVKKISEYKNTVSEKEKELEQQKANNEKLTQEISEKEHELTENDEKIKTITDGNVQLLTSLTEARKKEYDLKTQNQEYTAASEKLKMEIEQLKKEQISTQKILEFTENELFETKDVLQQNADEKKDIESQKKLLQLEIENIKREMDAKQKETSAESTALKYEVESLNDEKIWLEHLLQGEKTITANLESEKNILQQQLDTELRGMVDIQKTLADEIRILEDLLKETIEEKIKLEESSLDQRLKYEETENKLKKEIQELKDNNNSLKEEIDRLQKFKEEVSAQNFDFRQIEEKLKNELDQLEKDDNDLENLTLELRKSIEGKEDENAIEDQEQPAATNFQGQADKIEIEDEEHSAAINFFDVFEQVFNMNAAKQDELQQIKRRNQHTYTAQETSEIEASKQKMIDDYFENGQLKPEAISKLILDLQARTTITFKNNPCTLLPDFMKSSNDKISALVNFFAKAFVSDNFGKPIIVIGIGGHQIGYEIGTTIAKNGETNHYWFLCTSRIAGDHIELQTPKNTKKFKIESVITDQKEQKSKTEASSANMAPGHFYPPYVPCANPYYFPSTHFSVMHSQPQKYCANQVYYVVVANAQPNSHNFNF